MAEQSFPIKGAPLTDLQWGQVTLALGSGVLSPGGDPYGVLARDNAANTITLGLGMGGLAQAIVQGFYHRLDATQVVPVPAVSSATTYHIGLTYDPTKHGAASGPVALTCTTAPPSGGGKAYLPFFEIDRAANQLLTDAPIRDRRVYVSPTLTAGSQSSLPSAASMLTGTLCTTTDTGTAWRVKDGAWMPANAPWFVDPAVTGGWSFDIFAGGIEVKYKSDGKRLCEAINVYFRRTDPAFTIGTEFRVLGYFIPPDLRKGGNFDLFCPAQLSNATGQWPGLVKLNLENGSVQFKLASGSQTIAPNDAVIFSAKWSTW